RSYGAAPGYKGCLRDAMKTNIFRLMEAENFNRASKSLQSFFIRLSLISHLSVELISLLAGGDEELIAELEHQSAYVRRDNYTNSFMIHNLFLEFLCEKQGLLSDEEKRETYEIAADWCNRNGFRIDAISYYEKVGDYESIVSIFLELPTQVPGDIARYSVDIFDRAPKEAFDSVMLLAAMHVRCVLCLGKWGEAIQLMEQYEERYLGLPEGDQFRDRTLGAIYYCWGITRMLMCAVDDCYDFDVFFAKQDECLTRSPINPGAMANHPIGPWVSLVGSPRKGAPQEYIEAATRAEQHASHCMNGAMTGVGDLAMGELLYYQSNIQAAEPYIVRGLERARERRQFDAVYMAQFFTLRMAVCQGNFAKAEQTISDIEAQLEEYDYANRYITYDIAVGWYYTYLGLPGLVPDWLKEQFVPYGHTYFIENLGNRMKARYRYLTKDYPLLLAYMQEQRQREAILFGRVEMLSMEACVHFKMKNRPEALAVLKEAYETAAPNEVLIPFVALGKDMRTLCSAALKEPGLGIPAAWLETVKSKASSYAKRQSHVISEFRKAHNMEEDVVLSAREIEVLSDLSHGLSRSEIATGRGLSVNTVKMVINSVYAKLGAGNLADLIRIATERKMI
ncbi:MAG: LuxR C-terminal-related transcriptional regulator, partial [Clostridiales bacterium]|nr:LuxR C-terminal-related transcriptional regulator [Clostridiales bacterium]